MVSTSTRRTTAMALAGVGLVAALFAGAVSPASAASPTDGLLDLGSAADYGVLAATAVTNTGSTTVTGDLGIWPGTALTGFGGDPSPMISGAVHVADTAAEQAQSDTAAAYKVAAALTPTSTGLDQLSGRTLTPGVYAGGAMEISGNSVLTLDGSANSVWIFQATSSLTIGSGTRVLITGGASACNVFWQVGTAATIGTGAQFQGTVLAQTEITANTNATITGRLLAFKAAVTLDTDSISTPKLCPPPTVPVGTPSPAIITSGPPPAPTVGTPYEYTVTASGTPAPTFTLSAGALPAGLVLNGTSGLISGTPTVAGSSTFSITAGNGIGSKAAEYTLITESPVPPVLPDTPALPGATPGTPALPDAPVLPGIPVPPGNPGIPVLPGVPGQPQTPAPAETSAPTQTALPTPTPPPAPTASSQSRTGEADTGTALAGTGTNATPILVGGGLILLAGTVLVTAVGIRRRQVRTGSQ